MSRLCFRQLQLFLPEVKLIVLQRLAEKWIKNFHTGFHVLLFSIQKYGLVILKVILMVIELLNYLLCFFVKSTNYTYSTPGLTE